MQYRLQIVGLLKESLIGLLLILQYHTMIILDLKTIVFTGEYNAANERSLDILRDIFIFL